jgi:peptidoglycan/xylan/chitin deacetylase (PgdA/CDA1 family)
LVAGTTTCPSSLLDRGYLGTTFTEAVLRPREGKWLALTFDDGFRAVHDEVLPVLRDLGLAATAFVPTAFMGHSQLAWPGFDAGVGTPPDDLRPMSWAQVRALVDAGWEIGSHSRTHPLLTRLDDAALADELVRSREECEAGAGQPCRSVAYPFGVVNDRVAAAAARAGYEAGASLAPRRTGCGVLEVARTAIYRNDGERRFRAKVWQPLRSTPAGLLINQVHRLLPHPHRQPPAPS